MCICICICICICTTGRRQAHGHSGQLFAVTLLPSHKSDLLQVRQAVAKLLTGGRVGDRESAESARAAVRIHLFTLLFED